jgi:hypothetical protein
MGQGQEVRKRAQRKNVGI